MVTITEIASDVIFNFCTELNFPDAFARQCCYPFCDKASFAAYFENMP